MLSANKAEAGKHGRGDAHANRLNHDAVKLLKTQDAGYLRVVAGRGRREISRLEEDVGMAMPQKDGRKIIFQDEDAGRSEIGERAGKRRKLDSETAEDGSTEDANQEPTPDSTNVAPALKTVVSSGTTEALAFKSTPSKSKKSLIAEHDAMRDLRAARKRRKRIGELRIAKLEALKKRQREVMAAADELDLQRAKMARMVGGVNKEGIKWKIRERRR